MCLASRASKAVVNVAVHMYVRIWESEIQWMRGIQANSYASPKCMSFKITGTARVLVQYSLGRAKAVNMPFHVGFEIVSIILAIRSECTQRLIVSGYVGHV